MKKLLVTACAAVASLSVMANAAFATSIADQHHWKPVYVLPTYRQHIDPNLLRRLNGASTVPFWQTTVKSPLDGHTYTYEEVGSSPFAAPATTNIAWVPIILTIKFADGTVLSPATHGCGDTQSVEKRFINSPLFHPEMVISNGIQVGPAQSIDAFQRANWWKTINGSPKFHPIVLQPAVQPIHVTINAPAGSTTAAGPCAGSKHNIGMIDISAFDNIIVGLVNKFATPTQLPLVLSYNTFETQGGCCIIGYHNAYTRASGVQTYAISAYNDPGIFGAPIEDIHAWNHEIGEWANDPFVQTDGNNLTPPWGNVGQVQGCQNNLENGDPLTGTPYLSQSFTFTYHPQELVFTSWFYRTPSTGTGGKFSFEGTFTSSQGTCP